MPAIAWLPPIAVVCGMSAVGLAKVALEYRIRRQRVRRGVVPVADNVKEQPK